MSDKDSNWEAIGQRLTNLERLVTEIRSLVGPFGASLPNGTMLVQTLYGIKLIIDPMDRVMGPNLIVYRQWEPELSELLSSIVTPDTVFVDVGANIGYYTCLLGSKIGPHGRGKTYSIEPNPVCFSLLERNVEINWSMCPIECHQIAVGDTVGTATLSVPDERASNGYLDFHAGIGSTLEGTFEVSVDLLDNIVSEDLEVDILKIDVEGNEKKVLEGAKSIIARSPRIKIVLEWSQWQMARAGSSPSDMFGIFEDLGLAPYRLPNSISELQGNRVRYTKDELAGVDYDNILLARQ